MKVWQGALLFPLGAIAAGVSYDIYKRLTASFQAGSGLLEESSAAISAPASSPAKRAVLPFHPRIAVVELFGPIYGGARTSEYVNLLDSLRIDKRVKAVVLEIDSPGGSAPASNYLYGAVSRLAEEKPVVAFIRGAGTSGAYMVGCGATKVIALPTAIVGSIGVISINPVMKELLKRVGIDMTVTKSGPFKDMGAFYREATDEEREKQKELIAGFYDAFVELVAQSRKMPVETVRKYATGEIFMGNQAKEHGLVDDVGDMEMVLDLAAQLGGIPRRVVYARPRRPLLQRLASRFTASIVEEIEADMERRFGSYVNYRSTAG
ncbi:MAG: signal peptide peptidase SppA [Dehalococcoidia bacterium]